MKTSLRWIIGSIVFVVIVIVLVLLDMNELRSGFSLSGNAPQYAMDVSERKALTATPEGNSYATTTERDEGAPSPSTQTTVGDRLIVRSASLSMVATDVVSVTDRLKTYAESVGGFVVEANVSDRGTAPYANISLRIPAEKLDVALQYIRSQAVRVVNESLSGEDVTEEYVDLQAKLKNLTASAEQLRAIMKDATKTTDVLAVHRELERVQGEIDSLAGRKKYLENWAKLSSVSISISTDEGALPVVEPSNQWRPIVVAKDAMAAFVDILKFVANVAIWVIIFLPIWGSAILGVRFWKKRSSRSKPM
jgi:hypothetical protein